jgi:hypothetical protein
MVTTAVHTLNPVLVMIVDLCVIAMGDL